MPPLHPDAIRFRISNMLHPFANLNKLDVTVICY